MKNVYNELAEYRQMTIDKIIKEYEDWDRCEFVKQQVAIAKSDNELDILNFYKMNLPYLYSLARYEITNSQQLKFKLIRKFCVKHNIKKILDYGGGIGGLCIYLKKAGVESDYLDIDGCISNFAKWRFNKNDLNVRCFFIKDSVQPIKADVAQYDLVTASDVLEHIFDIDAALKAINSYLKKDGFFVLSITFAGGGIHLPKNAVYLDTRKFNDLLYSNGFVFLGQLKRDRITRLLSKIGLGNFVLSTRIKNIAKHGGNLLLYKKSNLFNRT